MSEQTKRWSVRVIRWVQEETSIEVSAQSERAARRAALRHLRDPDSQSDVWDFTGEGGTPRTVSAEEIC